MWLVILLILSIFAFLMFYACICINPPDYEA